MAALPLLGLLLASPGPSLAAGASGCNAVDVKLAEATPDSTAPAAKPADTSATAGYSLDDPREVLTPMADASRQVSGTDFDNFISEQVRLYYLSDVPGLMCVLSPLAFEARGTGSFAAQLTKQQELVIAAEHDVDTALAAADDAARALKTATDDAASKQGTLEAKTAALADAQTKLANAQTARAGLAAGSDTTAADAAVTSASTAVTNAESAVTTAQANLDAATTLSATRADSLAQANVDLRDKRVALLVAKEILTMAFAERRDNQPVWVAPIDVKSHDPLQHVFIFGFPDSQTLLLRGRRDDVKAVLEVIAKLDQPAPQTRLTLWTLELNMEMPQNPRKASTKYANKVNAAMETMQGEFTDCREELAATLSILRDVLVDKVYEKTNATVKITDRFNDTYDVNVEFIPSTYPQRRFLFYDPNVLFHLGFCDQRSKISDSIFLFAKPKWWDEYYYSRYILPDPANITTLGEALVVLVLAREENRQEVLDEFERKLNQYLALRCLDINSDSYHFHRLRRALNADLDSVGSHVSNLTGTQMSILTGLQREATDKFFPVADSILGDFVTYKQSLGDNSERIAKLVIEQLKLDYNLSNSNDNSKLAIASSNNSDEIDLIEIVNSLLTLKHDYCSEYYSYTNINLLIKLLEHVCSENTNQQMNSRVSSQQSLYSCIYQEDMNKMLLILKNYIHLHDWLYNEFGITPATLIKKRYNMRVTGESFFAPHETEPDIAKADQLLKQLNIAMEDDLDEMFVQPMLERLRLKLLRSKINVGVVQRTSLLATNRLAAQIVPRNSAELALGRENDVLAAAQQLTQLWPTLSAVDLFKSAGRTELAEKLGGLQQTSEDDNLQIYGITSGNTFRVTPIFDATGQAQRFRFDYVYGNVIKDPDNSSGGPAPRLPRTESIQIDTEVQVDNFEIREIAQFDNNVRLGISERKTGGIPVLRDLPFLSDIPLVGWFKLRGGEAAVVQHTIIFAQSTLYPTIGDIMDVLTQPLPDVEYLFDEPSKLQPAPAPPAPKYAWKGLVVLNTSTPAKPVDPSAFPPVRGLTVVVIEENAPGNSMRVASGSTDGAGRFRVEFTWNERYRYRLLIMATNGEVLATTGFKFIPAIPLTPEQRAAGELPTYDSSTTPIAVTAPDKAELDVLQQLSKVQPTKTWQGRALRSNGCNALPADFAGLRPAVQVETPPGSTPQVIAAAFNDDGSFEIPFVWYSTRKFRLVMVDANSAVQAAITDYSYVLADETERFNVINFPLPKPKT